MFTTLHYFKKLYHWLLPPTCILCHAASRQTLDLCHACADDLPILSQSCMRCAAILTTDGLVCGDCLKEPPAFDTTYALFSYQTPITKLIMELKFHQQLVNAHLLGKLMAETLEKRWYYNKTRPDVIIPIPLHPKRLQERGFNQALEIARPISKTLQIPIDILSCRRIKYTKAQAQLVSVKRGQNMKNAFTINRDLTGLYVAVLDDVITTGRTMGEFSKALKAAGAYRVDAWSVARAIRN
jgi:ComF family protein